MRTKRTDVNEAILAIIARAGTQGAQPVAELRDRFGLSRQQLTRYLSELVKQGKITSVGSGRGQRYTLAATDRIFLVRTLSIQELKNLGGEDILYRDYVSHAVSRQKENVASIVHHGFTELVNNVIEHAEAQTITFTLETKRQLLILEVCDDGIGVFRRNQLAFHCDDLYQAVVETAKGKRTSKPRDHAGEGLFFTSRLFDYFRLRANGLEWTYLSKLEDWSMAETTEQPGTQIHMEIDTATSKSPEEVFSQFTDENFQFLKKGLFVVEPLTINALYEHVSRSEAKRLLGGAEKFSHIIIDFKNTKRIGQGFADEVFRVFKNAHPDLKIEPRNMNAVVQAMVQHVLSQNVGQ